MVDILDTLEKVSATGGVTAIVNCYGRRWVAAIAGALIASCSLAVDSDRVQCSTDADCAARGEKFAGAICMDSVCQPEPRWSCLDKEATPPPTSGKFRATFLVQHIVSQTPLPGIKVRICRKIDVNCDNAVSETQLTDASGNVTFELEAGFDGYARLEGAEILPGLYFFNPPVRADLPLIPISIGSSQIIDLLAQQAGAVQESGRGVVLLGAQDCTGAPAPGVELKPNVNDPDAKVFYSEQNLPSGTAQQTDSSGYGGLLNAAPGSITFSASIAASRKQFGQVTLLVQGGSITYGTVVPEGI